MMPEYQSRYYRASGRIPFRGNALMLLTGTLAALVLSFIYALVSFYNPIIYLQIIVAGLFGVVMGVSIHVVGRAMKVRNRFFSGLITFAIGTLGMYFSWVWYIFMLFKWDTRALVFNPTVTLRVLQRIAETGLWEFKGSTPTGWTLYSVWLIEAAIVIGCCVLASMIEDTPFCEECDCWTEKREALNVASADTKSVQEALEQENYGQILALASQEISGAEFLSLQSFRCPSCDESGYLTATRVTIVEGKKGPEAVTTKIVPLISIPDEMVQALGELSKQRESEALTATQTSPPMVEPPAEENQSNES